MLDPHTHPNPHPTSHEAKDLRDGALSGFNGKLHHPIHNALIHREDFMFRGVRVAREESSREGHQGLRLPDIDHVHGDSVRGEAEGIKMIIFFTTVSEMIRALANFRLHIDWL